MFYQDIFFDKTNKNNRHAWVYLHGFPGPASISSLDQGVISLTDELKILFCNLNIDFYQPRYKGISPSNGSFSFKTSITSSLNFINHIQQLEHYETISIIGHSWGGLVLLLILDKLNKTCNLDKVLFLTPYCMLPDAKEIRVLLNLLTKEAPHLLRFKSLDKNINDLNTIKKLLLDLNIGEVTKHTSNFCLSATHDEIISINNIHKFNKKVFNCSYSELNTTHSFKSKGNTLLEYIKKVVLL